MDRVPHSWEFSDYADLTVIVDERTYQLHRIQFIRHNPDHFRHLFRNENAQLDLSELDSIVKDVWELALDYIYYEPYQLQVPTVLPLYYLANYFHISKLQDQCLRYFNETVSDQHHCITYMTLTLHMKDLLSEQFTQRCHREVAAHLTTITDLSFLPVNSFCNVLLQIDRTQLPTQVTQMTNSITRYLSHLETTNMIQEMTSHNFNIIVSQFCSIATTNNSPEVLGDLINLIPWYDRVGVEQYDENLVNILAQHFFLLTDPQIIMLKFELFHAVVHHPSLNTSDDMLCRKIRFWIRRRRQQGVDYRSLIYAIRFPFISLSQLIKIFERYLSSPTALEMGMFLIIINNRGGRVPDFIRNDIQATQRTCAYVEAERIEAARIEAERVEAARIEAERVEAARIEAERVEAARIEAERIEAARIEAERVEAARIEAERVEAERIEYERIEAARIESERVEAARIEAERVEAARIEAERVEAARIEAERVEAARIEAERIEAARIEAERVEAARIEAERVEAARIEAERVEAARIEAERG